jgi:hypothetical protein
MANPSQGSAATYPETWGDDQPENGAQELAIIDLPYTRNQEAQDGGSARVSHCCCS